MKSKCAVLREFGRLELEYLEVPTPVLGQVLVKVLNAGVCGSQMNEIAGTKGHDKFIPHLLGHEGYGVVVDIGDGVTKVKCGDSVIITWLKCIGLEGGSKKYGDCNAGSVTTFQEYSVISENRLIRCLPTINPIKATLFGCMIPTGWGTISNLTDRASKIRIFGVGNVGSAAVLAAKSFGMMTYAVDVSVDKLKYAISLGVDVVNVPNEILTPTKIAVDTTGSIEVIEKAFNSITSDGLLILVGNSPYGRKISFDPFEFIAGKRIVGSWGGNCEPDIDIPYYINTVNVDKLDLRVYPLDDVNKAISDFKSGVCAKIILEC